MLILCQLFTLSVELSNLSDIGHNLFDPLPFDDVHRLKFPNLPTERLLFQHLVGLQMMRLLLYEED